MPLSEVTLSAKLFSTNSYTLVKLLILVLRSSSGPLEAAETPVTPGPNTPPRTEHRTMTKAAKRTDCNQRGINTSHLQYSGVFPGRRGRNPPVRAGAKVAHARVCLRPISPKG